MIVNDDVAVNSTPQPVAAVLRAPSCRKIAGAAAERGDDLKPSRMAQASATTCAPWALHGLWIPTPEILNQAIWSKWYESTAGGYRRTEMKPADELVTELYAKVANLPFETAIRHLVLVNGMGGTPLSECTLANRKVQELLKADEINAVRTSSETA